MKSVSTYQIGAIMARRTKSQPHPAFTEVRDFITKYAHLPTPEDVDILAVWIIGTWTFSPSAPAMPYSYPYLYLTGGKGSGKTHIGKDIMSNLCRNHISAAMMTGPTLFRMLGTFDEESGEVIPHYPTLFIDEVDALFHGQADEALRGTANVGYKRGTTIPRAMGKTTINFPVYCPKILGGIDNGHLPDTITDRAIRIDIKRATAEQMAELTELYDYEVEDEAAEIQQRLSTWAKENAQVLREYNPAKIAGLAPRQWEISRALVQLGRALNIEERIRAALLSVLTRRPERPDGKVALYRSIYRLFRETGLDRLTTRQILERLQVDGVRVPGDSGKGLSAVLRADGINPKMLYLAPGHPGIPSEVIRETTNGRTDGSDRQRGYFLWMFDDAFIEYEVDDDGESS